jgi:hypothetical protein
MLNGSDPHHSPDRMRRQIAEEALALQSLPLEWGSTDLLGRCTDRSGTRRQRIPTLRRDCGPRCAGLAQEKPCPRLHARDEQLVLA